MMQKMTHAIFVVITMLFSIASWANYPDVPKPFHYVSDYTKTLSQNEWQTLENALADYGRKTSSQIAVVIVPTTNGEAVSSYSHNLFNKWGIGRSKEDNGVLLLIAKNDRKLFIATGRGLEAALPDAIASSIIRNDITPYFKQNQYAQGIAKGLSSIIAATQGEYAALPVEENRSDFNIEDLMFFLFFAFVILVIFSGKSGGRYISPRQAGRVLGSARRGGFGGGFGGGSRGGFGGGSSGGFGGGSTGGGGAGGSW
ncbi:TPM domain-containing protein [Frederiksenia canicola]|uniref:Methanol dehydrogenase n=1 Tax=Frederiksenia canicola TaxID=123824 RepID=A0AAE6X6C0_9PAST|nr:TPM domain-containing protein [Frederiksenia canicola]QIM65031.1 methanol dehydrogenase [Frederiksenia canicola]RPE96556.1 uncharacterized protein EDC49_0951 [Frederiksenia canicola]